jgi:hypothetical protein
MFPTNWFNSINNVQHKGYRINIKTTFFSVWTVHFLTMSKRPTNASHIQCIGAYYTAKCFGISMAFWNAETCKSILSTNTLNEWCFFCLHEWWICWSFTNHENYFFTIYSRAYIHQFLPLPNGMYSLGNVLKEYRELNREEQHGWDEKTRNRRKCH